MNSLCRGNGRNKGVSALAGWRLNGSYCARPNHCAGRENQYLVIFLRVYIGVYVCVRGTFIWVVKCYILSSSLRMSNTSLSRHLNPVKPLVQLSVATILILLREEKMAARKKQKHCQVINLDVTVQVLYIYIYIYNTHTHTHKEGSSLVVERERWILN